MKSLSSNAQVTSDDVRIRFLFPKYVQRITEIQQLAKDERLTVNQDSESDFWQFVDLDRRMGEGDIVLMDNGNLRLVWNDQKGSHLGLQFLGNQQVQYVIFKQRKPGKPISRVMGRDTFEGVREQIKSFELKSLLYPRRMKIHLQMTM